MLSKIIASSEGKGRHSWPGTQQSQFPIEAELGSCRYRFSIWKGEQLPDQLFAYDTETAAIQNKEIPPVAIATVYGDQGSCYFIHANDLPQFVLMHQHAYWVCHNAAFDFWVTAQHLQGSPSALVAWWDVAGESRLLCTMLLDNLIRLAQIDAKPVNRDLAVLAMEYCGLRMNKNDPYRIRYGELIGLPADAWPCTESGFWLYAACDPVATLQVAQRQFQISQQLIEPFRSQLLPNAVHRFGPLTCCVQVQASIALDFVSRSGCSIDLPVARELQESVCGLVEETAAELEQLLPGCFKRYGPKSRNAGQLQRTPSGVPRKNTKLIKEKLQQIAKSTGGTIKPPRVKNGSCTDAVIFWSQFRQVDPFIDVYCKFAEHGKLAQFFRELQSERVYPRYTPLVRTGRTSCSRPNLQQLPRDSRFREMVIAPSGFMLLQIDYSALELRTLAQVCLKRYGRSRLAELFNEGIDPHKNTSALLLGLDLQSFSLLPPEEQKLDRQRAKAINFGVPGGLGAASLVSCAKQSYGVEMTVAQAKEFRKRMVDTIYPELKHYLQDNQHENIASNLQTRVSLVRQALPRWEQVQDAMRIVMGLESTQKGEPYREELICRVWDTLQQLNNNKELADELRGKKPSVTLARRCFYGHAVTISGRLRGHVDFAQAANGPFQGLAADGNKLALFRLLRAGFPVCGFVHDEMLILIRKDTDYSKAVQRVEQILIESMQQFCPDIPIACEYLLADRWYKDAPGQPKDEAGRIVPFVKDRIRK